MLMMCSSKSADVVYVSVGVDAHTPLLAMMHEANAFLSFVCVVLFCFFFSFRNTPFGLLALSSDAGRAHGPLAPAPETTATGAGGAMRAAWRLR